MAARTFEELVNAFIDEYGIGGGGPLETIAGQTHAVQGQVGDLAKAIRLIRDSWDAIANKWKTWNFLWVEHSVASTDSPPGIAAASADVTLPSYVMKQWDRDSFVLDRGTSEATQLTWMPYKEFRKTFEIYEQSESRPDIVTVLPNKVLRVNCPADVPYGFYGAGWKQHTRLSTDSSTPEIPETLDRLIIVGAAILYADKVDAPEWLEGAEAEHVQYMAMLEANELDSFELDNMDHQDVDVSISGFPSLGTTR